MQGVLAGQRQVHVIFWVNILEADHALVFPFESLRIHNLFGSTWAPVGLGDAEELVVLPVGALAVLAAVVHEAAAGAARHFRIGPIAAGAGAGIVAGEGLLLQGNGFGRCLSRVALVFLLRLAKPSNPQTDLKEDGSFLVERQPN